MPGIPHDPKADINLIRTILRQGYEDGFPVLKELLQNADDAGGGDCNAVASTMVLLLAPDGLPGATHPLLNGRAGLCVLNDGDFRESDAICLPMLGLSNKATEQSSIGKFGIGLKTVFLLAEAFFYFSSREHDWSAKAKVCELLNPWGEEHRPIWEQVWTRDSKAEHHWRFRDLASQIFREINPTNLDRYVGVWIPLRIVGDAPPEVIKDNHPESNFESIFGPDWSRRLLELMPLLRHVRRVSVRVLRRDGGINEVLGIQPSASVTNQCVRLTNGSIHGEIDLRHAGRDSDTLVFRGQECHGPDELQSRFKSAKHWPRQSVFGAASDEAERATPHGAVVFSRHRALDGNGRLQIQHAVFLPLGEPQQNQGDPGEAERTDLSGDWHYSVLFHGFYFTGSNRRHIERFDPELDHRNDDGLPDCSEPELRRAWNCRLTKLLVAPNFLPSLAGFVEQTAANQDEVRRLVAALADSKFLGKYSRWLYTQEQFVFRLGDSDAVEGEWKAVTGARTVFTIPEPIPPLPELFRLLPRLRALAVSEVITFKGWPLLSSKPAGRLADDLLGELLGAVAPGAYERVADCRYLLKLIPADAFDRKADSALTGAIVRLANGLIASPMPEDEDLASLWKEFFKRVPTAAIVRLPADSTEVASEVAHALSATDLPVALLWQDWRADEGNGTIPWNDLLPVLQSLGALNLAKAEAIKQRSGIAIRLLKASEDKPQGWTETVANLPLFLAGIPAGQALAASIRELQTAHKGGLLFIGGDSRAADLAKAAPAVQPILVDVAVVEAIGMNASICNSTACVRLLRLAAQVAEDFADRKPLFQRLLPDAGSIETNAWAALRCLVHGKVSEWTNNASLLQEPTGRNVFARLTTKALEASCQAWRLIPAHITGQLALTADQQQRLNLQTITAQTVEALVKETDLSKVDCAELSSEECDTVLLQFSDVDVLRGLNIHESVDNRRVCIRSHTYINDADFDGLPPEFQSVVTRVRDRPGYTRFQNTDGSNRLVKQLNWEAVIELALAHPSPSQWRDVILNAIGELEYVRAAVRDQISAVAWLPLTNGHPIKPSELLDIPGAELELDRLDATILNGHVPLLKLNAVVRDHGNFAAFRQRVLPSPKGALNSLAQLLREQPVWFTGLSVGSSMEEFSSWVRVMGDAPERSLPVALLVKALNSNPSVRELLPAFLASMGGRLPTSAYVDILRHLTKAYESADAEVRRVVGEVFVRYVTAISEVSPEFAQGILRADGIRLPSASGAMQVPAKLTLSNGNIAPEDQLDELFSKALEVLNLGQLPINGVLTAAPKHPIAAAVGVEATLRTYFLSWRAALSTPDSVGALLCLLGPAARCVSAEYFSTWSSDMILDWIDANDEAVESLGPIRDRLCKREFRVSVVTDSHAPVRSVVGNAFRARLARYPTSLLVEFDGSPTEMWQTDGHTVCHVRLRNLMVGRGDYSEDALIELLRATASAILAQVLRAKVDVRPLFAKLAESTQLHVTVAQNMIVDQALAFLRQVGAQSHPCVRQALALWDDARRQEAVEEIHKLNSRHASELRREARERIRSLIRDEPEIQTTVLTGVKRKLAEFQYSDLSVPFELWQNADDAVVELLRLGIDPGYAARLGLVAMETESALLFCHWGRLINEFAGPNGAHCRNAGYDRDLEKMLVPAISDKSETSGQGEMSLTGKYGLGFKSVFLVSDAPEVLSGCVDFVIRGGIFPVPLEMEQREDLFATLRILAPNDWRRGTIVRLPMRSEGTGNVGRVLALFRRLAPLLVAFSRRLKRLRFRSQHQKETEVRWQPRALAAGIEVGKLEGIEGDVTGALILSRCVAGDRLQFLLGLNSDGAVSLPDDVPVFWVTAPTCATPGYGFAANGPFDPDVGRVQLAPRSEKNRQLAGELAGILATLLMALQKRSLEDWLVLRDELGLATETSAYDFWDSLWVVLGRRFAHKCRRDDAGPVAELARLILWESEGDGMRSFYDECVALPSGLWGDYRTLTCLRNLRHVATGALDRESVFAVASGWPNFRQQVPVGSICSNGLVASTLVSLGVRMPVGESVLLANVVEWELGQNRSAGPKLAARLGQLITPEFLKCLKEGAPENPSERDEREHAALSKLLGEVQVNGEDGSWRKPTDLVVATGEGVDLDEAMRAAFAPPECSLHPDYSGPALKFFLASRPRLDADVQTMVAWVLQAGTLEKRVAALRYLLTGELRDRLADALRHQRSDSIWLWQLSETDWVDTEFSRDELHQIRAYVLRLFDIDLREGLVSPLPPPPPPPPPPLKRHVWTVEELWKWWKAQRMPKDDYTLEGGDNWALFHGGGILGEQERKAELQRLLGAPSTLGGKELWYRLFGYACLVSAGRTVTELRTFWLDRLNPDGFWKRTSGGTFSEATQEIFERAVTAKFTNNAAGGEQAYFWRRVFYDVRKAHRMVQNDFPAVLLDLVNQGRGDELPQFLRTGGLKGIDQPRWIGTFGQSADTPLGFIIRELFRLEVIKDETVRPYAFYVCRPVLRALAKIGWIPDADSGFTGEAWLSKLAEDPTHGDLLKPFFDIPLLHMGITHRGDKMPVPPG